MSMINTYILNQNQITLKYFYFDNQMLNDA